LGGSFSPAGDDGRVRKKGLPQLNTIYSKRKGKKGGECAEGWGKGENSGIDTAVEIGKQVKHAGSIKKLNGLHLS